MADGATPRRSRLDRSIALRADQAIRTPEGFIRVPVRIAKPGVMVYIEGGRPVRELVPAATLADPEWLASMEGKPITLEHPAQAVGPENIQSLQVGTLLPPVQFDGQYVTGDAMITHAEGLAAVSGGTAEVSPGYDVEIDDTPGTDPTHGPYDRIQTRRIGGNHLALTDQARGGRDIKLLLRADAIEAAPPSSQEPSRMPATSPLLLPLLMALALDPAMYSDDAAASAAIGAKLGEMKATAAGVSEAAESLTGMDAMIAEVGEAGPVPSPDACAKMDSKRRDARNAGQAAAHAKLIGWYDERKRLDSDALRLGMTTEEIGKLGSRALRRAIAAKLVPSLRADASDDYVRAILDLEASSQGRTRTDAADTTSPYREVAAVLDPHVQRAHRADAATPSLSPAEASLKALTGATH